MIEVVINGVGSVKVYVEKFVPEKHKIKSCGDYTCLIDGNPFFGSDGEIPSEKIARIVFLHQDCIMNLDVNAMYDPNISSDNIKYRIKVDHYWGAFYKVTGRFSDGAGAYIAQWIVTNGGSIRTHISDYETLYELLKKNSGD
jgi:hypothetical protein